MRDVPDPEGNVRKVNKPQTKNEKISRGTLIFEVLPSLNRPDTRSRPL